MAGLAGERKVARAVRGVRGAPVIRQVAALAGRRRVGKLPSRVALGATDADVRAGQGEGREGVVIECHACPRSGRVTHRAVLREARRNVIGILRAREIFGMAAEANSRRARELISQMALRACQSGVHARQREARDLGVIEARVLPDVHVVAVFASLGKLGGHVVEGGGGLIILKVAVDALRAEPRVDSRRGAAMAVFAGNRRMGPEQRKAVVVVLHGRNRHLPAPNCVTFLTTRSELPPVQIRVAVRTTSRRLREHQVHMASLANYVLVETEQRITGLSGVIELGLPANGLPRSRCMTVLARDAQFAVGIRGAAANSVLSRHGRRGCENGHGYEQAPDGDTTGPARPSFQKAIDDRPRTAEGVAGQRRAFRFQVTAHFSEHSTRFTACESRSWNAGHAGVPRPGQSAGGVSGAKEPAAA